MALKILASCINCDMCEPECPNQAIALGEEVYEIDPDRCTECLGHYDEPTCVKVCPIDCVVPDLNTKRLKKHWLGSLNFCIS